MQNQSIKHYSNLGMTTALLLLGGFFFPVVASQFMGGSEVMFPEIEVLFKSRVPFSMRAQAIMPFVSAILCFVAVAQSASVTRIVLYLIAGYLPFMVMLMGAGEAMGMAPGGMRDMGGMMGLFVGMSLISLFAGLGLIGIFTGASAAPTSPKSKMPLYFALVGGCLLLLSMVIPLGGVGSRGGFSMLLIAPFQAMKDNFLIGIALLIFIVLLITLAIFAIVWGARQGRGANHAHTIKSLFYVSFGYAFFAMLVLSFVLVGNGMRGGMGMTVLTAFVKMGMMITGAFFAKCIGLMELVTHVANQEAPEEAAAVHQGPPTAEQRLSSLQFLLDNGNITQEEYAVKRKEIIDGL